MAPIDYLQIKNQIGSFATQARMRQASLKQKTDLALRLLHREGAELEKYQQFVRSALCTDPGLRSAVPFTERMDAAIQVNGESPETTILAVDGSQINPSHHEAFDFALLNLGGIVYRSPQAPHEIIRTTLLEPSDLAGRNTVLTEEMLAMQRDLQERRLLLELANEIPAPVVALTDGTLEVYGEPKQDPAFERPFGEYLAALREMAKKGLIVAGYVDQPRANLAARLLELGILGNKQQNSENEAHHLSGVTDAMLFTQILQPGQRSAIFAIQSRSAEKFSNEIGLHFFYLNVGRANRPQLARVELPAWVAQDATMVELLHKILLEQCRIMGANPYPYILHRAHEIAVVRLDEKDAVLSMLTAAFLGQELELGHTSAKQSAKDLKGRSRYTK